jgi:hypothetical protein
MLFFMLCGAREGGFGVIAFYCGLVWVEMKPSPRGFRNVRKPPAAGA